VLVAASAAEPSVFLGLLLAGPVLILVASEPERSTSEPERRDDGHDGRRGSVDRPLDMMRTVVNVWSDSCGTATIARSEGEKLLETNAEPAPARASPRTTPSGEPPPGE